MTMTTTMEELDKRVAALERELSNLRQMLEVWTEPMLETEEQQVEALAVWERVKEQMGIRGEPIGAENLQAMMLAEGIKPEENILSRGIIEAREE
jgi:hypothetical protein